MRIGAKVPNSGPLPADRGIAPMAAELEAAGFESLWVSDHIVMPRHIESRYPFAADGKATWPSDTPYFDAMIALAVIATATRHAVLGTAVLVLPLRHPVELAKQAASIDVLSDGRLALGVGAGWMAEEFDALDVPFGSRGRRLVEWVEILGHAGAANPSRSRVSFTTFPREFSAYRHRAGTFPCSLVATLGQPSPGRQRSATAGSPTSRPRRSISKNSAVEWRKCANQPSGRAGIPMRSGPLCA